ncbi:hypothetical protein TrLO_g8244 [Triparma laevis f. longispina]|uniref:Uncharacterized protein n=1 Tax=Triparma laevis f. longispina TaxID=1714387 RepID=A0A9W7F8P1_9STRA|nr:hypothetical protein TrLO_g8244 [Triparma laevis f. longispina]
MISNDAITRQMKALAYRKMLDEQIRDNDRFRPTQSPQITQTTDFDSSYQFSSRRGGGGEPIRRADGSIVANLRTLERTANVNLPFDRDTSPERDNYSPTNLQLLASHGEPPTSALLWVENEALHTDFPADGNISGVTSEHKLFNHSYDSPEEKESLSLRRQRQRELRRVLEDQIREKEERRAMEKKKKEEEERLELEQMHAEVMGEPFSGYETEIAKEMISERAGNKPGGTSISSSSSLKVDVGGVNALNSLLNSPIRTKIVPSDYSSDGEKITEQGNLAVQEALVEKQETLLRTIKDQSQEIEHLTQKLQGIEEGRNLFSETISPRNPDSFISLFSPIKKSLNRNSHEQHHQTNDHVPSFENSQELRSSSEYVPLASAPALITTNSFSMEGFPLHSDNTIVSSKTLQSSFGLTSFQKTYNQNQYENRKEEALESFLRAFQQGRP